MRIGLAIITMFVMSVCQAENYQPGEWSFATDSANEIFSAGTINNSDHTFGQMCFAETLKCVYFLDMSITCEDDYKYSLLINSNVSSGFAEVICTANMLVFTDFDNIDNFTRKAMKIGFVLPMDNATFKVSRFGLINSSQAIDDMRTNVLNLKNSVAPGQQPSIIEHRM